MKRRPLAVVLLIVSLLIIPAAALCGLSESLERTVLMAGTFGSLFVVAGLNLSLREIPDPDSQ